jgi:hypothetical protein
VETASCRAKHLLRLNIEIDVALAVGELSLNDLTLMRLKCKASGDRRSHARIFAFFTPGPSKSESSKHRPLQKGLPFFRKRLMTSTDRWNSGAATPLDPLYQILRFQKGDLTDNPYADLFPGFRLLRNHGVSLQNHACSSIACVPSRSTIMTGQYSALYRDKSYTDLVNTFLRRKALGVEAGLPPSEQS